ncbi:MAG: hypothetical protein KDD13_00420 [Mangrovimonas sp.]|nr:hypothetical protein [Mangrovimonas sp.]
MKKTRKALEKCIENSTRTANGKMSAHNIIMGLIKEGWVELDEPREFWIGINALTDKYTIYTSPKSLCLPNDKIIHVREVVDE